MNRYSLLSLAFLCGGISCFVVAFLQGDLEGGVLFIIPFFIGTGIWSVLGVGLLFLSFLFFTIRSFEAQQHFSDSPWSNSKETNHNSASIKRKTQFNGIIFIGPIPIVFGQNWKSIVVMLFLGIIIFFVLMIIIIHVF